MEIRNDKLFSSFSVSQKLVDLIESHADELTNNFIEDIKSHSGTPTYHTYDERELYKRAYRVYSNLGKWISRDTTKEEISRHYTALGEKRKSEGFSLSEVIQALIVTRNHLWLKVLSEGVLDTVLDLNQAMELYNRVVRFFDKAIYYVSVGYE
ncbi:hypothetical protein KGY73_00070 [bacterium]|nr:hypothetical protein [bacterium]